MQRSLLLQLVKPVAVIALVAIVVLLGVGSPAWATPAQNRRGQTVPTVTPGRPSIPQVTPPAGAPAAGEVRQSVAPGVAATVATNDGAVAVVLPANSLIVPGTVGVRSVPADQLPTAGAGFALLGKAIEITLFDAQGNPIANPTFANPVQICFAFSADELAGVGGQSEALVVQFYDTSAGK